MIDATAHVTIDHDLIKSWAEERGGHPAVLRDPDETAVRIAFERNETAIVGWEVFFRTFEERNLALLYQSRNRDGRLSRFCRLVTRN
ncbi:MAG: hypothetical protein KDG89_03460 [Geminicoccaceae bacterium]|nr:hypothetical protein [Geminicoccaceae bacterium]